MGQSGEMTGNQRPPLTTIPPRTICYNSCAGGAHTLHGCVRWNPIRGIRAWRAWRLPGRWPDGGRRSTVARWTRRRTAPAYAPIPDRRERVSKTIVFEMPDCNHLPLESDFRDTTADFDNEGGGFRVHDLKIRGIFHRLTAGCGKTPRRCS